jgi:phosphotriesterase-related protein
MGGFKNTFNRRDFLSRSSLSIGSVALANLPFATAKPDTGEAEKRNFIPTLTGQVKADELGITLMHEHILWFSGTTKENPGYSPIPDDQQSESIDFAVSVLNDAARVGIVTVVDLTPFRPFDLYKRIAEKTTVQIIVSTGYYRRSKNPQWLSEMDDEKQMEDRMLKEVMEGIDGTKLRAGIIKVASESGALTDWEKKVFRAAARVNKVTDVPIATHTGNAMEQFNLLVKSGANPQKIFLSHVDVGREGKPGELFTIVKEGGYLEVDTFGQGFYTPWKELVSFLRAFFEEGFGNKIFISIDSNWHWENGKKVFEGAGPPHFDPNAANRVFSYMITDVVPMLLKSGFSMKEIKTFLIENPMNFFKISNP